MLNNKTKNTQENSASKAKSRLTVEQLRNRTKEQIRLRHDTRSPQAQLRRAKLAVNKVVSGRNIKSLYSLIFAPQENIQVPTKDIYINNLYINKTPVVKSTGGFSIKIDLKTKINITKDKKAMKPRRIEDVPTNIVNLDYSSIVKKIDRYFLSSTPMAQLRKLRVFSLDALKFALWCYEKYPHEKHRGKLKFDYFFVVAKNFSDENNIKLQWCEYYA